MLISDEKTVAEAREKLAARLNVAERALTYIGDMDCSHMRKNARLLNFNVVDKNHIKYKSTVAEKHGW